MQAVAYNVLEPALPLPPQIQDHEVTTIALAPTKKTKRIKETGIGTVKRKDEPCLDISVRGSMAKALESGMPAHRLDTLQQARAREFANSGLAPRRSRWNSWVRLHRNWFGHSSPVLPLTVESIAAVLAQLGRGSARPPITCRRPKMLISDALNGQAD